MKQFNFQTKYDMMDRVYHITPESQVGIITNIRYSIVWGVDYLVSFGVDNEFWILEHELTTEKVIV